MSYSYNYVKPLPPSYSGVTINISNPAVSIPPSGICQAGYCPEACGQISPYIIPYPSVSYQYNIPGNAAEENNYGRNYGAGIYKNIGMDSEVDANSDANNRIGQTPYQTNIYQQNSEVYNPISGGADQIPENYSTHQQSISINDSSNSNIKQIPESNSSYRPDNNVNSSNSSIKGAPGDYRTYDPKITINNDTNNTDRQITPEHNNYFQDTEANAELNKTDNHERSRDINNDLSENPSITNIYQEGSGTGVISEMNRGINQESDQAPIIYSLYPQQNHSNEQLVHNFPTEALSKDNNSTQTEQTGRSYNSGTQNINTTNIYQTVPTNNNSIPQSYPPQYYLSEYVNQARISNPSAMEPVPQNQTQGYSNNPNSYEVASNETSKEIINELNELQEQEKALEQNGRKTKVVALTNEYIMSLENYLNNPNTDIRLMAAKEILTRLDEDRSRYNDAALNALINKMLQDPSKLIRIAAMSALSSELASGNEYTVQLLSRIQQNPDADPEDVLEVAQILLKRASSTEVRYVPVYNQQQGVE